jgi:hypothetical protein
MSGISTAGAFITGLNNAPAPLTLNPVANFVFDPGSLTWVKETQPGAPGGAVTIADGADVAEGSTTNAAVISDANGTVSGKLRGLVKWAFERMPASLGQKAMTASLPVVIASDQSAVSVADTRLPAAFGAGGGVKVDGSGTALPISGTVAVSTALLLDATFTGRINTQGQKTMAASTPVVIASDQSTPLPAIAERRASTLMVSATAAVNNALTATLPAAGAGCSTTSPAFKSRSYIIFSALPLALVLSLHRLICRGIRLGLQSKRPQQPERL